MNQPFNPNAPAPGGFPPAQPAQPGFASPHAPAPMQPAAPNLGALQTALANGALNKSGSSSSFQDRDNPHMYSGQYVLRVSDVYWKTNERSSGCRLVTEGDVVESTNPLVTVGQRRNVAFFDSNGPGQDRIVQYASLVARAIYSTEDPQHVVALLAPDSPLVGADQAMKGRLILLNVYTTPKRKTEGFWVNTDIVEILGPEETGRGLQPQAPAQAPAQPVQAQAAAPAQAPPAFTTPAWPPQGGGQ